ncbi:MAG: AAA family ATPase [Bradymonadaceae bacterium]
MKVERILNELSRASAIPDADDPPEICQTHISVVFLTDDRAYKLKKPVDLGFVDYSDVERRRHFCEREVELNRRTTEGIYLGVVPVRETDGGLSIGGESGEVVDWAVEMRRLPADATIERRLEHGEIGAATLSEAARRIAEFHASARTGPEVGRHATFRAVAANVRDNFEQSRDQVGRTVEREVFARVREASERALETHHSLIERRAEGDVAVDGHGDLRLEHIYHFPEQPRPRDFQIVDCVEFDEALRCADPVSDASFVAMDLRRAGRWRIAETFIDEYLAAADDAEGRPLVSLYVSYRAAVRGKVMGMKAVEGEVDPEDRDRAARRARAYWSLALDALADPDERPGLVLVAGLPATGKSTVADQLADRANLEVIDTDVVRKELAGLSPDESASDDFGEGIYSSEWSERTYEECRRRAERVLRQGGRVAVDATFNRRERRGPFVDLARTAGVRWAWLDCRAPEETVADRMEARDSGPSDADLEVYRQMRERRDPPDESHRRTFHALGTDRPLDETIDDAVDYLRTVGLY